VPLSPRRPPVRLSADRPGEPPPVPLQKVLTVVAGDELAAATDP
jgi:hypothetical protein